MLLTWGPHFENHCSRPGDELSACKMQVLGYSMNKMGGTILLSPLLGSGHKQVLRASRSMCLANVR